MISDSCLQLVTVFESLSFYLFGLQISHDGTSIKRPIDLILNNCQDFGKSKLQSEMFDLQLATMLIDGRLNHGLPPPQGEKQMDTETLLALTQNVCHLIRVGKESGFLTGDFSDGRNHSISSSSSSSPPPKSNPNEQRTLGICGGASCLWSWLNNLSNLGQKQWTNQILDELRTLLADRYLFYNLIKLEPEIPSMNESENPNLATNRADQNVDEDEDDLDELFEKLKEHELMKSMPSLRLLNSKININDLCRYLDLGSFNFPECTVSFMYFLVLFGIFFKCLE